MTSPRRQAPTSSRTLRLLGAVGMARGVLLLTAGRQLWTTVASSPPGHGDEVAMRLLAARELTQGLLQLSRPRTLRRLFVTVDLLHAGSMVVVASLDRRRRRPALLTGGLALASGVLTWRAG